MVPCFWLPELRWQLEMGFWIFYVPLLQVVPCRGLYPAVRKVADPIHAHIRWRPRTFV